MICSLPLQLMLRRAVQTAPAAAAAGYFLEIEEAKMSAQAMNCEIEVKLGLLKPCPQLKTALQSLGEVSAPRKDTLSNTYFDTPQRALFALKAGLRIRKAQSYQEQTLKVKGAALAGVHARQEYNVSLPGGLKIPDLSLFPDDAFPEGTDIAALQQNLVEQCAIDFKRTCYDLKYKGAKFEIAVDEGFIKASGIKAPILELEIELKEGPSDSAELIPLFDEVVRGLGNAGVPLTLEPFSKMHRAALLMGAAERSAIELPKRRALSAAAYLTVNLKSFETLLGLFLVQLNPLYLGYMTVALKNLRRACGCVLTEALNDDNVNDSESCRELKADAKHIKRTLKKLARYVEKLESRVLPLTLQDQDYDLSADAQRLRRRITKTHAYSLPLHLRALLLKLQTVKTVNQKA